MNLAVTDYQGGMSDIGNTLKEIPINYQAAKTAETNQKYVQQQMRKLDESIKYNAGHNQQVYGDVSSFIKQKFGDEAASLIPQPTGGIDPNEYTGAVAAAVRKIGMRNGLKTPEDFMGLAVSTTGQQGEQDSAAGGTAAAQSYNSSMSAPGGQQQPAQSGAANLAAGSAPDRSNILAQFPTDKLSPEAIAQVNSMVKSEIESSPFEFRNKVAKIVSTDLATTQKMRQDNEKSARDFKNASELQKQGDAAAMDRTNANNNAAKSKDAYDKRTFALKDPQIKPISAIDASMSQLDIINNVMDDSFIGQVAGRKGNIAQSLGLLGDKETVFRSALEGFKNELLKERSGAAVTENEMQRFIKEVMNVNTSPEQFKSALLRVRNDLQNKKSIYLTNLKKAGYQLNEFEGDIVPVNTNPLGGGSKPDTQNKNEFDQLWGN